MLCHAEFATWMMRSISSYERRGIGRSVLWSLEALTMQRWGLNVIVSLLKGIICHLEGCHSSWWPSLDVLAMKAAAIVKVAKVTDTEGNEIGGATGKGAGYKYFGAAKQLPGVRELFEKEAPRQASCPGSVSCLSVIIHTEWSDYVLPASPSVVKVALRELKTRSRLSLQAGQEEQTPTLQAHRWWLLWLQRWGRWHFGEGRRRGWIAAEEEGQQSYS